jgi:hypothetical protein
LLGFRVYRVQELLCRHIVNGRQCYQLIDRQVVNFAFQPDESTGRDVVSLIVLFPSKAETTFLNLAQRELPLQPNSTELPAIVFHKGTLWSTQQSYPKDWRSPYL